MIHQKIRNQSNFQLNSFSFFSFSILCIERSNHLKRLLRNISGFSCNVLSIFIIYYEEISNFLIAYHLRELWSRWMGMVVPLSCSSVRELHERAYDSHFVPTQIISIVFIVQLFLANNHLEWWRKLGKLITDLFEIVNGENILSVLEMSEITCTKDTSTSVSEERRDEERKDWREERGTKSMDTIWIMNWLESMFVYTFDNTMNRKSRHWTTVVFLQCK